MITVTIKEFIYMKQIELDLLRVRAGIFEKTPKKDFYIKRTTGYITPEYRYSPDQPRDNHGRFTDAGGSDSSGGNADLTESSGSVRLDSNGVPFKYPTVRLPKKEYANVMDEIGRRWNSNYENLEYCRIKFSRKTYYFENRGIGDYNIYKVMKG